jgi:hypothetical protein
LKCADKLIYLLAIKIPCGLKISSSLLSLFSPHNSIFGIFVFVFVFVFVFTSAQHVFKIIDQFVNVAHFMLYDNKPTWKYNAEQLTPMCDPEYHGDRCTVLLQQWEEENKQIKSEK